MPTAAILFEITGEDGLAFALGEPTSLGGDRFGVIVKAVAVAGRAGDRGNDHDRLASLADLVTGGIFDNFVGLPGAFVQTFGIGWHGVPYSDTSVASIQVFPLWGREILIRWRLAVCVGAPRSPAASGGLSGGAARGVRERQAVQPSLSGRR
jgi:hypothetical protein